jgi:hypothetical protein
MTFRDGGTEEAQMATELETEWGPLAHPVRPDIADGKPPWRDNAFLAFWSEEEDIFGVFHASTSPNAEGRRARFSFSAGGTAAEIIEPVDPGTLSSASLAFDLGTSLSVSSPQVEAELEMHPRFGVADYSNQAIPPLIPEEPTEHFQQAASVEGTITLGDRAIAISGPGVRDRTWGYRDESLSITEYIAVLGVFEAGAVTAMRLATPQETERTEGYLLPGDGSSRPITDFTQIARDASGLLASAQLVEANGSILNLEVEHRCGGFWVPMGWKRIGPTMSAYDEFVRLTSPELGQGTCMVEHGVIRKLF